MESQTLNLEGCAETVAIAYLSYPEFFSSTHTNQNVAKKCM